MRSFEELARRIRVGLPMEQAEFAALDRLSLERHDLGSWMLLRVGHGAEALAAGVATHLAGATAESIIRGACELKGTLRHAAWHVLARLAESRPAALDAIEAAMASWPARSRPWMRAWVESAELGRAQPYHRLAQNLGMQSEHIPHERVAALAPIFATLRELDLSEALIDDEPLRALVKSEALARLQVLSLARAEIDDAHCEIIASEARLPSLSRLVLNGVALFGETIARLICASTLPELRTLEASGCGIDLVELAEALADQDLQRTRPVQLDLSQCSSPSEGLMHLARTPALRLVAGLDLHHVEIAPHAAQALARSEHASSLVAFSVNESGLGEGGVRALLDAPWMPNVRSLRLFNQRAGDAIAPALQRLGGGALETLDLMHGELGLASARALGAADLSRLRELYVSYNPLGDEGLAAILANPTLSSLEVFEASKCGADVQTARAVSQASQLGRLRLLQLGDHVSNEAVETFAGATLPGLRRLQLVGAEASAVSRLAESPAFSRCYVTNQWHSDWESLA